jgi:hypothetical protein
VGSMFRTDRRGRWIYGRVFTGVRRHTADSFRTRARVICNCPGGSTVIPVMYSVRVDRVRSYFIFITIIFIYFFVPTRRRRRRRRVHTHTHTHTHAHTGAQVLETLYGRKRLQCQKGPGVKLRSRRRRVTKSNPVRSASYHGMRSRRPLVSTYRRGRAQREYDCGRRAVLARNTSE